VFETAPIDRSKRTSVNCRSCVDMSRKKLFELSYYAMNVVNGVVPAVGIT